MSKIITMHIEFFIHFHQIFEKKHVCITARRIFNFYINIRNNRNYFIKYPHIFHMYFIVTHVLLKIINIS